MGVLLIRDIYHIWYDSDGYTVYYIPNHNAIILVMMEGKLMVDFYFDEWTELCKCADSIELPTDLPDSDLITIYGDDKHLFRASNHAVCLTLIERMFTVK